MNKNFKIVDYIAVELGGIYIDLHNDFDFMGFSFDREARTVVLKWRKSDASDGVNLEHLRIVFSNTEFIRILMLGNAENAEDQIVASVGYLPISERENTDGFYAEEDFQVGDAIIFSFEDGSSVTIGALVAVATVE